MAAQGLAAGERRSHIADPQRALMLVGDILQGVEAQLHDLVRADVRALSYIADYLTNAGGKRLRPALGALGAQAIGVPADVALLAAGELVHLGSLLHDDVVDEAQVRRGQTAAHVRFGNAATVLAGDFCTARALEAALTAGGLDAGLALARTVAQMSAGEVLQLQRAGQLDTQRDAYYEIVDRKSASLIAWCASAPALAAGHHDMAFVLEAYGRHIGRAYQIVDDVLDYEPRTGKVVGADLRERKVTLPLLIALERNPDMASRLTTSPDSSQISRLMAEIRASGALDDALAEAESSCRLALDALDQLPPSAARDALVVLGHHIVERTL